MKKTFIASDDIPTWSGHSTFRDGNQAYELKYGTHETVSMMQAMLGQQGPVLEANAGSCLVIAAYSCKHQAGLLIHLWRDEDLCEEGAELIRKPLTNFPRLADNLIVHMLTSEQLDLSYSHQLLQVEQLIAGLAPQSQFHRILGTDRDDDICVGMELDTALGRLTVNDDFADTETVFDYPVAFET